MTIPYDMFVGAFLSKIQEYDFIQLSDEDRDEIVDSYLMRAVAAFSHNCAYDLGQRDEERREFTADVADADVDEIVDIVSEGMIVQWMKPYVYRQENLQNVLNTRDYSTYSPAELLLRVGNAYTKAQKDYTQMIREYSYSHGDLTVLHL